MNKESAEYAKAETLRIQSQTQDEWLAEYNKHETPKKEESIMKIGINVSIDVTKIDKSKLFTGKKGKYLDIVTFVDLDSVDEYGNNGMATQKADKGEQGAILGNSKVFWREGGQAQAPKTQTQQPTADETDPFADDIPF